MNDLVAIEARIIRTTPKAVLLDSPEHGELWVPRSVVQGGAELEECAALRVLHLARWWCEARLPPEYPETIPF